MASPDVEKIDEATVRKVASLGRLHLSDSEILAVGESLRAILKSFGNIANISTEGVEPLISPTEISDVWRKDEVQKGLNSEQALAQAPARSGNSFKVPPVV
jgi:aspartyl-tRNA(Asn)/glutamyl-tRNA(Gln) amidotransferase subunit C